MRSLGTLVVLALPAIDCAVIASVFVACLPPGAALAAGPRFLLWLMLVVPVAQYFLRRWGVYDSHRVERPAKIGVRVFAAHLCAGGALVIVGRLLLLPIGPSTALGFSVSSLFLSVARMGVYGGLRMLRRRGLDQRRVLMVGLWERASVLASQIGKHPEWGLHLDCVLALDEESKGHNNAFLTYPDRQPAAASLEELLHSRIIDEILIPVGPGSPPAVFDYARRFAPYGLQVRLVYSTDFAAQPRAETYAGAATIDVLPVRLDARSLALKRAIDLLLASFLIVLAAPVMALIAVSIYLTSSGPVLFRQTRVGLNGRRFQMLKFRTMIDGAELQLRHLHRSITRGPVFKDAHDYRITPLGRILRRFSLDELPQLFNVLQGHMSLVGPRPLPVAEASQVAGEYRRRFSVPPGMTCIWQVSGRSDVDYERWMRYDLQYIDSWSLWSDAILLLRTIPAVLSGKGAY